MIQSLWRGVGVADRRHFNLFKLTLRLPLHLRKWKKSTGSGSQRME
jgi:hypothetical protein